MLATLEVFAGMVTTVQVKSSRTAQAAEESYCLATDIADYLVKKGLPFRDAYTVVGKLVIYAIEQGKSLHELDLSQYRNFSPLFEDDVYAVTIESSIAARNCLGGTAPGQVEAQLARARAIVDSVGEG